MTQYGFIRNQENNTKSIRMNEAKSNYTLIIGSKSKDLPDNLYDKLIMKYDLLITPKYREFPMPWDADISIKGSNLVLEGHADSSGFGSCITEIPLRSVSNYLEFEITGNVDQADIDQLTKLGWDIK